MMDVDTARRRSQITAAIRRFFDSHDYLEVETPILAPALIPERAIEVFSTTYRNPFAPPRSMYLIPSPELWMKRLIADGWPSMYQITKAFRNGESVGSQHNPEFTILEYYTVGGTYEDSFELTKAFLDHLERAVPASTSPTGAFRRTDSSAAFGSTTARPSETIVRMTVAEAFDRFARLDLNAVLSIDGLREELSRRRMQYDERDDVEALFNRLFVNLIEPRLGELPRVALFDYPHAIPTTARRKAGTPWAERWELYIDGIELANCYTEETNPDEVSRYFATESAAKRGSLEPHPPDTGYLEIFRVGFPKCSGVAMGVDRLMQAHLGRPRIEGVILFPLSSIFR